MAKQLATADELFVTAKDVKKIIIDQMVRWKTIACENRELLAEFYKTVTQLNKIFISLGTNRGSFSEQLQQVEHMVKTQEAGVVVCEMLLEILDEMLLAVIWYRQDYCLIRRQDDCAGLASHFITNLGQIVLSLDQGYIPYVDTMDVENVLTPISRELQVNAWELYFGQPFGVTKENVLQGRNHVMLTGIPATRPSYNMDCLGNRNIMQMWKRVQRKYMPLSGKMMERIAQEKKRCLEPVGTAKIMGVLCRGTDYTSLQPQGHPVQPRPKDLLVRVEQKMEEFGCEYCYLATEDKGILQLFQERLGESVLYTQEQYYDSQVEELLSFYNRKHDVPLHTKNQEYLVALALLAECNCLIAGRTSGTIAALMFADEFEYVDIWNDGFYGVDSEMERRGYII